MSAAAATEPPAAPKKGKKKLIIIIVAAVVLLAAAGGGALIFMKKKAAAEEDADGDAATTHTPKKATHDPKHPPTFVPLDPFTVNLADRDAERFLQVGMTLEISDTKVGDQIKLYMPAIRNNILMVLAHKTAAELLAREGKAKLSLDIKRETERALGVEPPEDDEQADAAAHAPAAKKKKQKKAEPVHLVSAVHYSNFIIQ